MMTSSCPLRLALFLYVLLASMNGNCEAFTVNSERRNNGGFDYRLGAEVQTSSPPPQALSVDGRMMPPAVPLPFAVAETPELPVAAKPTATPVAAKTTATATRTAQPQPLTASKTPTILTPPSSGGSMVALLKKQEKRQKNLGAEIVARNMLHEQVPFDAVLAGMFSIRDEETALVHPGSAKGGKQAGYGKMVQIRNINKKAAVVFEENNNTNNRQAFAIDLKEPDIHAGSIKVGPGNDKMMKQSVEKRKLPPMNPDFQFSFTQANRNNGFCI